MTQEKKIFIAGYDVIGENMAGPGMRSLEIASFLASHFSVTLSFDEDSKLDEIKTRFKTIPEKDVRWNDEKFWGSFDVAIMPGTQTLKSTLPENFPIPLIVDIYDPYILENLEMLAGRTQAVRDYEYLRHLKAILEMLSLGDRFIVTSERTKDFFLGMLTGWGKVNPVSASGKNFENLFLIIPFGIPDEPFNEALAKSSAKLPAEINQDDELILWAGGLWDWLDPLSIIDAMPLVLQNHPKAKLYFMGYRHPNKHVPLMEMAKKCMGTADKLKLNGKSIIFREWTPFEERIPLLGRANIGVSLHEKHIETRFSFRTRIMDYIWAGIPMVISSGDSLSDELVIPGVSLVEPGANPNKIANAIINLLEKANNTDEKRLISEAFESKRAFFKWNRILDPLVKSIQMIKKSPDNFYSQSFHKMLKDFPLPSKPGIIAKGIDKITR